MGRLDGKTVWVTGGGWNIGRAVSLRLAREGARVAVTSRREEVLEETAARIRAAGGACVAVAADLTDPRAAEEAAARAEEALGPLYAVVALAGGFGAGEALDRADPLEWWAVVERNLRTAFHAARAVLPGFRARGGHVVFCSGGGAFHPMPGVHATAYACAKAAVCRLTDQLQAECWDLPVHVNCIEPGAVRTSEQLADLEEEERRTGRPHPVRTELRGPDEAAELVVWLLTEAAGHVRGHLIAVHDDWWKDPHRARAVVGTDTYRLRRRT